MIQYIKKFVMMVSCIGLLCTISSAYATISKENARHYIQTLGDKVIALIESNKTMDQKEKELDALFNASVDSEVMGKFVLGRYVKTLDAAKLNQFLASYKHYLERSYVPRFRQYTNQKLKIIGVRTSEVGSVVQTEIVQQDNVAARVDYHVDDKGQGPKIYDIVAEGVSLTTTQRSDFSAILAQKGIDELIARLDAHVRQEAMQ